MELKWLMLNSHKRWFHSSRVKFFLGQYVCELVFGVDVLDLDFWVQVNAIEQPIKRNSVVSRHMSHCGTSAFDNQLYHGFTVLENVQLRFTLRSVCVLLGT